MPDGVVVATLRTLRAALGAATALAALAAVPVQAQTGGACEPSPTRLCLQNDRFQVEVEWQDFSGNPFHLAGAPDSGVGHAETLSQPEPTTAGYFWFFDSEDVDLVVNVLDATQINGRFWVFMAPLTNVEFRVTVVDTQTGVPKHYDNPPGSLTIVTDTEAFPVGGSGSSAPAPSGLSAGAAPAATRAVFLPAEALPSCADPAVACVQGGRFAIEVDTSGLTPPPGMPPAIVLETATSALVSAFASASEPPIGVRVVDGRAVDGRFWIFISTPSASPELVVRVTDLETHQSVSYEPDQAFRLAFADNDPFAPDPPSDQWLTTDTIPGFRFQVRVTGGGGEIPASQEADCIPETLCISGAVPGRSELFLRIVGPKPNGFLWPNIVKFSTSQLEVWIEQLSTGQVNYYELAAAGPASDDLTGLFDRRGFAPLP